MNGRIMVLLIIAGSLAGCGDDETETGEKTETSDKTKTDEKTKTEKKTKTDDKTKTEKKTKKPISLRAAAARGDLELVKGLLSGGANIDEADFGGETALHYVANRANAQVALYLIEQGANVNATSKRGMTPLLYCAKVDQPEKHANAIAIAKALLAKGAKPNVSSGGDTPLSHAINPYLGGPHAALAVLLIEKGANPNGAGRTGRPILWEAVSYQGNRGRMYDDEILTIVKALVEHKADLKWVYKAKNRTLIHAAARWSRPKTIEYLIGLDVFDLTLKDKIGRTPLDHARELGRKNVPVLVKAGAKPGN